MKESSARTAPGIGQAAQSCSARLPRYAPLLIGIFALLGALAIGPASASAALPTYEGDMSFPAIHGPSDPEEYSWHVDLSPGQELEQLDERHVEVYYSEGHHPMFGISAMAAHDAVGTTVPTSLSVTQPNVITLTVHHRAGNPAASGAPFAYPILAGEGWEGGPFINPVAGPKDEQELREERERLAREKQAAEQGTTKTPGNCIVPRLKSESLKASKRRLKAAGCKIGAVRKRRNATAMTGEVVKQSPRPGMELAPGTSVDVTLGA